MIPALLVDGTPAARLEPGSWALHGASVFTTIRLEEGRAILWERHLARLASQAARLGFPYPGDEAFEADLRALRELGPRLLLRLTVTDDFRMAQASAHVPPAPALYEEGVRAVVTSFRVHPDLARYKTGSHLAYRLARREAEARGAFEGLLLDGAGHVVDGSRTSPLLLRDDELVLLEGGLEGITREAVAEEAERLGFRIRRSRLREDELEGEILLAGSGVGLLCVGAPSSDRIRSLVERFRPR